MPHLSPSLLCRRSPPINSILYYYSKQNSPIIFISILFVNLICEVKIFNMYNPSDPKYNPMMLQHNVHQPPINSGQLLIKYSLFEKCEQLQGYENPQISKIFDGRAMFANLASNTTEITVSKILILHNLFITITFIGRVPVV